MPRYYSRKKKVSSWVEDEDAWGETTPVGVPSVCEHEATYTGLLDTKGDCIMRAPNPVGFIWEDE